MLELNETSVFENIFLTLDKRQNGCAYFYRIPGYNDKIKAFIQKYGSAAKRKGTVIEGKISSPDESQITYFQSTVGTDFSLDMFFLGKSIARWMPQLNNEQCSKISAAVFGALNSLKDLGKNYAMVKNFYIRLMCWMFYKFPSVLSHVGESDAPKVLYGGKIGRHELLALKMLCDCGADVVFLQTCGETEYNQLDPTGNMSRRIAFNNMVDFPNDFNVKSIEKEAEEERRRAKLYAEPAIHPATNVWLVGKDILEDVKKPPVTRGNDSKLFYNAFCRLTGVPDKLTYKSDLFKFYTEIKNSGRRYLIVDDKIPTPQNEEIAQIDRKNYDSTNRLVTSMMRCLKTGTNRTLNDLVYKAFVDVMFDESAKEGVTSQRLSTTAACCACWLNRYLPILFTGWETSQIAVFIYFGNCKNSHEAAFVRILSRLPCDVLILDPNLNTKCQLEDDLLFELKYNDSLNMTEFPTEMSGIQIGTAAYHAEQELDQALYNGTGIFRDYQYHKANSVILRTMYEEIDMLWREETRFRPNFSVVDDTVNLPVIFAKVSGVKDGQKQKYWKSVQSLVTENTMIIGSVPYLSPNDNNPMKYNSTLHIKNGKLNREAILARRDYQYRHLREETQSFIFDKIDLLISSRIIKGTFENGAEYLIAATLLFMPPVVQRMIQGFDFTKINPKVIYINVGETPITLEDSILMAFLSLCGFDILFLVPTGYQTVEGFFNKEVFNEHKIGEFMYDLQVPRFKPAKAKPPAQNKKSLFGNIFRKGN